MLEILYSILLIFGRMIIISRFADSNKLAKRKMESLSI